MIESIPRFLNGIFAFGGAGLDSPAMLPDLAYTVPSAKRAQMIYFRGGNSSDELAAITLLRDGKPMRYFPIGAKSSVHVPLSVVEDIQPDTRLEVAISAPSGAAGSVVIDIGLLEI